MPLIEANRPRSGLPGSNEYGTARHAAQMCQHMTTDAALLFITAHIRMPDERYVFHALNSHHAKQPAILFISPQDHAFRDLTAQLVLGHIWFGAAVGRNHAAIGLGAIVNDLPDLLELPLFT